MESNKTIMKYMSFFTKYSTLGASSRYRHFKYFYRLQSYAYSLEIDSFLDTRYLKNLYDKKPLSKGRIILSYFKRILSVLRASQSVVMEYELLPYIPYSIEKFCLGKRKYIVNLDDNIWENYKNSWLLRNKYDRLIENASGVIVANIFLQERVKRLNANCIQIPTTIDLGDYEEQFEKYERFTIVWIGTPVTYRYILSHKSIFSELAKRIDFELLIVASTSLESQGIAGVNMRFVDWSSASEVEYLKRSHVGIMPLDTDAFSQGKSAFKLIQYLGAGIPLIGSDVGENRQVIHHGENGYIVSSQADWISSIELLHNEPDLYVKMSQSSKKNAFDYSIQKFFPIYKGFLDKTL